MADWKWVTIKLTAYFQSLHCLSPVHLTNLGNRSQQDTASFVGILLHRLQHIVNTYLRQKGENVAIWLKPLTVKHTSLPIKPPQKNFLWCCLLWHISYTNRELKRSEKCDNTDANQQVHVHSILSIVVKEVISSERETVTSIDILITFQPLFAFCQVKL